MELDVAAQHPAGAFKQLDLLRRNESGVGRRQPIFFADLFRRAQQGLCQGLVRQQQARTRGGRKRHGNLQFGVIAAPGAVPGIGPGMIKHIFALAVRLEIGRERRGNPAVGPGNGDRHRVPARTCADRTRFFERGEESMAEKGVGAGQRIPLIGRKFADTAGNAGLNRNGHRTPAPSAIGASAWAAARSRYSAVRTVQVRTGSPRLRCAAAKRLGRSRMS